MLYMYKCAISLIALHLARVYSVMSTAAVAPLHVKKQCAFSQTSKRARDDIKYLPCRPPDIVRVVLESGRSLAQTQELW
jgi:hypothetical protein